MLPRSALGDVGEYEGEVGEYEGEVGEYEGEVGEYEGEVGEYEGEVGEYEGEVGITILAAFEGGAVGASESTSSASSSILRLFVSFVGPSGQCLACLR